MYTDFLWLLDARNQYKRQRAIGMAGFLGILLAFFMIWKWNSIFLPIFDKLGFVALASKLGLINEDMAAYTFLNFLLVILYTSLFIGLTLLATSVVGGLLKMFGATKLGTVLIGFSLFIMFSPFLIPILMVENRKQKRLLKECPTMHSYYKRNKKLKPLLKEYANQPEAERMFSLYKEQSLRNKRSFSYVFPSDVTMYLNRAVASIADDRNWLIGYNGIEDQWYLLFPNPLPEYASQLAKFDPFNPYKAIYDYPKYDVHQYMVENGSERSEGYHVPSMPIEFVWDTDKREIALSLAENSKVGLTNTKNLISAKISAIDTETLFNKVSQRDDLSKWVRHAHVMVYYIPEAYPSETPFAAEKRFYQAVKNVPYVDEYYSEYAAEVEKCRKYFRIKGVNWHSSRNDKVG